MEYISYNMGTRDFPDIYARALGPAALELGHIYQANPSCPWYNYYIYPQGFFQDFSQGGSKRGITGYRGAMWYDPPGSKLGDPGMYCDQEHIVKVGLYCITS